jgi:hypothetical protein
MKNSWHLMIIQIKPEARKLLDDKLDKGYQIRYACEMVYIEYFNNTHYKYNYLQISKKGQI